MSSTAGSAARASASCSRIGGKIVSQVVRLGRPPALDGLIGPVKMLIDGYLEDRLDEVTSFSTRFINTMKQDPMHGDLRSDRATPGAGGHERGRAPGTTCTSPMRKTVLDQLLSRYIETLVYQAAADNIASEQSARMVAMKAARTTPKTSSKSCSSSTTRTARRRSRRNSRKSSAAQPPCSRARCQYRIQYSRTLWHKLKAPSSSASARSSTSNFRAMRCRGSTTR